MQVTKIMNESELPTNAAKVFNEEELKKEYNYYLAQQHLNKLFESGMISEDEFNKITQKTDKPSLLI